MHRKVLCLLKPLPARAGLNVLTVVWLMWRKLSGNSRMYHATPLFVPSGGSGGSSELDGLRSDSGSGVRTGSESGMEAGGGILLEINWRWLEVFQLARSDSGSRVRTADQEFGYSKLTVYYEFPSSRNPFSIDKARFWLVGFVKIFMKGPFVAWIG